MFHWVPACDWLLIAVLVAWVICTVVVKVKPRRPL